MPFVQVNIHDEIEKHCSESPSFKKAWEESRKEYNTFADYFNDETRVSKEEREKINLEVELIGEMIKQEKIVPLTTNV